MQVNVETTGTLGRRLTISLPAAKVEEEINSRFQKLSRQVKLPGFRPGKVPKNIVEKKFGGQVLQEVVGDLIQSSYSEALGQEELIPAGGPNIEPKNMERGEDLEYVATFEVFPEIEATTIEGAKVERPVSEVSSEDIDRTIEVMRKQRTEWEQIEEPAAEGTRVVIDFVGSIDGEPFENGEGKDFAVEIGTGHVLKDMENGLIGMSAGEENSIEVAFPEDYPATQLAGKAAQFEISMKEVGRAHLPEIDEKFAKSFGVAEGGVEKFREEVKQNMGRELEDRIQAHVRAQVMGELLERNPIELPSAMVESEIDQMVSTQKAEVERQGMAFKDEHIDQGALEKEARRRVTLGLVIREIVNEHSLQPDGQRVRGKVEKMAGSYEKPAEFVQWYMSDRNRAAQVEALVIEEQVIDALLEKATVEVKEMDYETFMNPPAPDAAADNE